MDKNGNPVQGVVVVNLSNPSADYTDAGGRFKIRANHGDCIVFHRFGDMEYVYSGDSTPIVDNIDITKNLIPGADEEIINNIYTLYLTERYKECIAYCLCYVDAYRNASIIYNNRQPYVNWSEINRVYNPTGSDALSIATICYLGTLSAYQCSLYNSLDWLSFENGIAWAKSCTAMIEDYLNNYPSLDNCSAENMYYFLLYSEWGKVAASCGAHLLTALDDKDSKKDARWLDKKYNSIDELAYKKTVNREDEFEKFPIVSYKIIRNSINYEISKDNLHNFKELYLKCFHATQKLIESSNNNYNSDVHSAVTYLTSLLAHSVVYSAVDKSVLKKLGEDYGRFCMEYLTKLQDLSYYINGASIYSYSSKYTLHDIQEKLEDDEIVMLHFEGPVAPGSLYAKWDLGTRYRNYALVISKKDEIPNLWHRGYIGNDTVNDLSSIKDFYPNAKRIYYVGTPRMSFIDIAGTDSTIVRLHSLSQLLNKGVLSGDPSNKDFTFIGDLNYWKEGGSSTYSTNKGAAGYERLLGPAVELETIKEFYPQVRAITGDYATRGIVMSEICGNKGIVHISTHGDSLSSSDIEDSIDSEDLALKKFVMDNSRLILSGYNDKPNSSLTSLSGSDVLVLKKIDADLVFLDACLSGSGAVGAGGAVGMAEAFHLIGARNVICYLEPVYDEIATKFAGTFYKELSKGASYHDAFFIAKSSIKDSIKVVLWE